MSAELVLLATTTAAAGVGALFAILGFLRTQQLPGALTAHGATQILRAEQTSFERSSRSNLAAFGRSLAIR
jgi:hypothetical protein